MQQKRANALIGNRVKSHIAALPRSKMIALFIATVFALPSVGFGEGADEPQIEKGSAPAPFTVDARADELYFYPCSDCHAFMDSNNQVRALTDVEDGHPAVLEHGNGRIWCLSCHESPEYDQLRNLLAEPVEFDDGYQVCSGCHSQKYRDWTHGAHGKRAANWLGERRLYSCVECHNPHRPSILPRVPKSPPPIRAGLEPMAPGVIEEADEQRRPEWERAHAQ